MLKIIQKIVILLSLLVNLSSCSLVYEIVKTREKHQDKYDQLHKNKKKRKQLKKKGYPKNPRKTGNGGFDKNRL